MCQPEIDWLLKQSNMWKVFVEMVGTLNHNVYPLNMKHEEKWEKLSRFMINDKSAYIKNKLNLHVSKLLNIKQ